MTDTKRAEQARTLARAAHQVVENYRNEIDLTKDDPTVDPSWNYRLPDEHIERRRDPWMR